MTFVIGAACVDVLDRACVEECPVDCIYTGDRMAYIHPTECVDCGACEPVCPVEAISLAEDVAAGQEGFVAANAAFFDVALPGHDAPLGSPGGAALVGDLGVDTPFVAEYRK
ncbi:ferredoxin [Nocardia neocaledoniensis]|jgi:NAD-dependent dihydropyrimidine dehydrogenase PreA subunit|uniref:ferredoxin n=1 Tax=Nocardia neocaledoniensis TaxID=236511 RepID=UPI002458E8A8|nr:ferredoxin [Nocardia neocaledoniensis]